MEDVTEKLSSITLTKNKGSRKWLVNNLPKFKSGVPGYDLQAEAVRILVQKHSD